LLLSSWKETRRQETRVDSVTIFGRLKDHSQSSNKDRFLQAFFIFFFIKTSLQPSNTRKMLSQKSKQRVHMSILVRALLCTRLCNAIGPHVLWTRTLPNGGSIGEGLRKGTGVVLSANEESLWVTSENGSLNVLDAANGSLLASFQPEIIDGHYTESRSSVSLYQSNESIDFGVYAVVDVPERHFRDSTDDIFITPLDTRYVRSLFSTVNSCCSAHHHAKHCSPVSRESHLVLTICGTFFARFLVASLQ
jgi:hypothetical protein